MAALRSARLEALLGSELEQVQHSQLMTLISNQVAEAFDLDFKSEMYGSSDRDKRDAAIDVAALANTAGGLLILGIEEDDQARASAAPGVALSEADERRIRQIVGSNVVPMPAIDVLRIPDPARAEHGLVLIAVPRSPLAPHAVLVNEGLRYPKRNGATTRYLSEPEVADAYRERFAAAQRQVDRAREIEADALNRLATTDDQMWIVVSLVPDLAGELVIDQAALNAARTELMGRQPLIMPTGAHWLRISIGRRRLLADGTRDNSRMARYLSTDLHDDGAGAFGAFVLIQGPPEVVRRQQPLRLGCRRGGFLDPLGSRIMTDAAPPSERVATLDGLAAGGRDLVSAAYLLASDVFQEFGWAEAAQLTRDGGVRLRYWNREWRPYVEQWAETAGISTTEETLPG